MKCAKPASVPAYRVASAAQYSLGAGAMRSKKVFFLYCIIFFLKSQACSPLGSLPSPHLHALACAYASAGALASTVGRLCRTIWEATVRLPASASEHKGKRGYARALARRCGRIWWGFAPLALEPSAYGVVPCLWARRGWG